MQTKHASFDISESGGIFNVILIPVGGTGAGCFLGSFRSKENAKEFCEQWTPVVGDEFRYNEMSLTITDSQMVIWDNDRGERRFPLSRVVIASTGGGFTDPHNLVDAHPLTKATFTYLDDGASFVIEGPTVDEFIKRIQPKFVNV